MVRKSRVLSTGLICILFAAVPAKPVLVIDSQGVPGFQDQVNACLELFSAAGGETADIVDQLNQPAPDVNRHTIQPPPQPPAGLPNTTTPDSDGTIQPDGSPGPGSGSTIQWDPTNVAPYADGTPRDPCASLLHELKHALDIDKGKADRRQRPAPDPGWGIPEAEIDACREENRYRNATPPLPQRGAYGARPLPPDAIF